MVGGWWLRGVFEMHRDRFIVEKIGWLVVDGCVWNDRPDQLLCNLFLSSRSFEY